MEKLFTISQVAEMFKVSYVTINRWLKLAEITPVKHPLKKVSVITQTDLDKLKQLYGAI